MDTDRTQIDRRKPTPAYRQRRNQLAADLERGDPLPGEALRLARQAPWLRGRALDRTTFDAQGKPFECVRSACRSDADRTTLDPRASVRPGGAPHHAPQGQGSARQAGTA